MSKVLLRLSLLYVVLFTAQAHALEADWHVGTALGSGMSGTVRIVTNKKTNQRLACKTIVKDENPELLVESAILSQVQGSALVMTLTEMLDTDKHLYLFMPIMKDGDLFDWAELKVRSEDEIRGMMTQILDAVSFIHVCGVVHRDLKLENFLLDGKELKLTDFGLSTLYRKGNKLLTDPVGSIAFASPELFIGRGYCGCANDIWAIGVIAYILGTGYAPFNKPQETVDHDYEWPNETRKVSQEHKDFVDSILNGKMRRPDLASLKRARWIKGKNI